MPRFVGVRGGLSPLGCGEREDRADRRVGDRSNVRIPGIQAGPCDDVSEPGCLLSPVQWAANGNLEEFKPCQEFAGFLAVCIE